MSFGLIIFLGAILASQLLLYFLLFKKQPQQQKLLDELAFLKADIGQSQKGMREEFQQSRQEISDNVIKRVTDVAQLQRGMLDSFSNQLLTLTKSNEDKLEQMRGTVEKKLKHLQEDNAAKIEKMRETVDEKLQSTLEKRLAESFTMVSDRLEKVHQGLGEMQTLASGVGDLKKVLTNVKSKGVLGEIQLDNLLEQLLTNDQYAANVKTKEDSNAMVEFAIRLPGQGRNKHIWLPIDAKFPTEDYHALVDAYEIGDITIIAEKKKILCKKIKQAAKDIREKYVDPPNTTDFAILFLPFEGLYAEVLSNTGVFETIQREQKIIITGPTTISAFLNSLQMGFKTLAIEKRTSEVWNLLGAIKTEFGNFGTLLTKTKKKLDEASNMIESAEVRTRVISRKMQDIQKLPKQKSDRILGKTPDLFEQIEGH